MPNKTIYVSDDDVPLFQRAQELNGGSLSAAITRALRRLVEVEEGRREGYEEVVVRVGPGAARCVRFSGVLLGRWGRSTGHLVEELALFRSRTGKLVVHVMRAPDPNQWLRGWRSWVGLGGGGAWASTAGEATLSVFDSIEEAGGAIPPELSEVVAAAVATPTIEELDI